MEKEKSDFSESFFGAFKSNGTLLTTFAVVLIIVSGISIVDNRENWWITVVAIAAFFLVVFLFMNAKVVLKVAVVSLITLLISAGAFQVGMALAPTGVLSLLWMGQVFFMFFGLIAYSSVVLSGRSKWALLGITQIATFVVTYFLSSISAGTLLGVPAGALIGVLFFVFFYKVLGKTRYSKKNMPDNILNNSLIDLMIEVLVDSETSITPMPKGNNGGGMLVWDDHAYYLHPIEMDAPFGDLSIKRKSQKLSYRGKNISPWLLSIVFNDLPLWVSRGADITLVLLDTRHKNGESVRVIGVDLPDTDKKLPVAIVPSPKTPSDVEQMLHDVSEALESYKQTLSIKQKTALSRIGKIDDNSVSDVDDSENIELNDESELQHDEVVTDAKQNDTNSKNGEPQE